MKVFRMLYVVVAMLISTGLHAQGIVLELQETLNGKTSTGQFQVDKTHIRADSRANGESMALVYDDVAKVARLINFDKKTYMEMDRAMQQQVQQQLAEAQAQLEKLPPAQRAIAEQMMRGRGGARGAAPATIEYRQTGSDKVGKWACTKYDGYQGQQKVVEICTADLKDLGMTLQDFEVAKHLVEFVGVLIPDAANQVVLPGTTAAQGYNGVPVRRIGFPNGKPGAITEVKDVRREAIPASAFDLPAGFKKQEIPGMRGK